MIVLLRFVAMGVGVNTNDGGLVTMVVVPVVVAVGVLVLDRFVAVPVVVALGEVEKGGNAEEQARQGDERRPAAVAEEKGGGGSQEGRQREERACSSGAQCALRAQVQAQAEAVA